MSDGLDRNIGGRQGANRALAKSTYVHRCEGCGGKLPGGGWTYKGGHWHIGCFYKQRDREKYGCS